MHLPVGPNRFAGASPWGSPDHLGRAGAGDRARLDQFRLHRDLQPEDGPAYAAARLAAALAPSPPASSRAGSPDRRGGRWAHSRSPTGGRPGPDRAAGPGWPGGS